MKAVRARTGLEGKDPLAGFIIALGQLLHRLAVNHLPMSKSGTRPAQFKQMVLHRKARDIAACQPVVPALQGDHVVPDDTGNVDRLVQSLIAPVVIETVFERLAHLHHWPFGSQYIAASTLLKYVLNTNLATYHFD